ncbi:DUF427 domain-containing protein [Rhizomonospora bruguierae]|uniref:DUF427 domain-containing protein n=1 Tax=Rhizomonospora bruguierae TaxID=1581705 RepID=UPI001BD189E4|nr:DUF427 domain-containing protein [Micromonospora sp. NBRC 107566]
MDNDTNTRGRVRVETGAKRVRAFLGGDLVADTRHPLLVWENPYYPAYYVPAGDVRAGLVPTGETKHSTSRGEGQVLDVRTGRGTAPGGALRYPDCPIEALRDAVRLDWAAMDEWLEEDEPVYTHPRNPYARVDILASSRHVRVELDGQPIAETHCPHILFETYLPPRYYLPLAHVRTELLRPSATRTHCPYKGEAGYFSVEVNGVLHEDVVWIYRTPLPESQKIAGLVSFYPDRVAIHVDGQRLS